MTAQHTPGSATPALLAALQGWIDLFDSGKWRYQPTVREHLLLSASRAAIAKALGSTA